jgi:thioredoxin reductase
VDDVDVLVVGGGVAGLSGALTLARARRSVLVLDAGEPRNAPAEGVHGYLTRDGMPPRELLGVGADEVRGYGGRVLAARAVSAERDGERFVVRTADGQAFRARRLLVTTGLVDELPDVPGLRERWGHDVLHCPYCHGWEFRDQPIGVLGTGPWAVHQALLFRQWTPRVTLFVNTAPEPTAEEWEQLAARDVAVVEGPVAELKIRDDRLHGVRLAAGTVVPVAALAVMPRFVVRSEILTGLGLESVEHPRGVGTVVEADAVGATAVPGLWVAGNVADPMAGVVAAAAAGMGAAAQINADLVAADTAEAVRRRQEPFGAAAEATNCERVLGERRHGLSVTR